MSLSTSGLPALLRSGFPGVHPVAAAGPNALGVVCGYGASDPAVAFPSPITVKDGDISALNSRCEWAGDIDGDGAFDPLVADNPSLLPGAGGGFIADIVVTSLNSIINGFDLTIDYNTTVLNAVLIDQQGLLFGGNNGCTSCTLTTAISIDQTLGEIRLSQAILGVTAGPGGNCNVMINPVCTSPNQELFRIRFDVVGAGRAFINFSTDPTKNVITTPGPLAHTSQNGVLSTDALFSLVNGQATPASFNESLTFSNPTPGSSITFTAANAICTYCTGTFTYNWDFSSQDSSTYVAKIDATGKSVTVTPPPPVIYRVTLTVTDGVHTAFATRNLPLKAVGTGPTTAAQGVAVGPFSSKWLGGIVTNTAGYSGQWRFCPGSVQLHPVCSSGPVSFSQAPPSITQTSSVASVSWAFAGFYNDFFSLSDTAVAQVSATPNTVIVPVPINITGATPAYTVAVTPDKTSINAGQFVTFTAAVTYAGTYPLGSKSTAFSYTFDFGDGNTTTVTGGGLSIIEPHTFKTGGNFIVKVTPRETGSTAPSQIQENGYSSGITVIPPLAASFTFAPPLPTVGQTITFTPTVTGGNPPYSFAWDFGDGSTSILQSPTHAYATAGPFTVALTVTDSTTPTPQTRKTSQMITVYPPAFDFSIAWSSTSASLTAGGSTAPNVVATLVSGTTASVACSVSLPSPAVAGLSAVPLAFSLMPSAAGASQAVAIATTSATPAGTYTISVSCAGGGVTRAPSTQFSLTVTAPAFDYTIAWSPASASIAAGAGTTPSIVATLASGTTTSVTCTVSLPSPAVTGLSASPLSFSITPTLAGATQVVTISTTVFTPGGTYTIGVSCTGGVGTHTANFSLTVTAGAFDYSVAWSPTTATIAAGAGTSPDVVAILTSGTATSVSCTVSLPSPAVTGLSASPLSFSLTPALAPGASQVEAISTTVFTPGGTYTISVSCTGGVGTHTANFSLTVTAAAFNYSVAWSPTSATIAAGAGTTPSVVATLTSGQTIAVTCTVNLPSPAVTGLSASPLSFSIAPALAPGASQVVTISTTTLTPAGTYTIGVSCTGGVGTHTANFSLIVSAAGFDYTVAWSPTSATVAAGASSTPNLVATLTSGTAASVTCTVSLPSPAVTGLSASPLTFSITPAVAPGASQAVMISATVFTPGGTYAISVSCTGGVGTHTANFSLSVTAAAFDYTVAWSPTSNTIAAGASTTPNVVATLTSGQATSVTCTVTLPSPTVTGLSSNPLSFSITPALASGASQAVTISTTTLTLAGTYAIGVSCTGGVGTHTVNFSLTVTAAGFDYTVALSPTSANIAAGASTTPNVIATLASGSTSAVTCTVSLPSPAVTGLSVSPLSFSISPVVAPGASQAVMISTTVFTPGGTYAISVSCTGGVGAHTANFSLTVTAAAFDYTVAWSPTSNTVAAGSSTTPNIVATLSSGTTASVTCTISLPSPAVTGLSVSPLSFSITPALTPSAIKAVTISTTTLTPAGVYIIGVSCTGGVGTHTANFSLTVSAAGFDYTVAWSPTSATIAAGSGTTPNFVGTLTSGQTASVTCTVSLPSPAVTGLSASPLSFSSTPALAPGATQAVTITTTSLTPAGTYTIGVSCTGGVGTHTADFSLTVTAAGFDYTIAWSPTSATIAAGASTMPNLVATLTSGTAASVTCTVSLPSPAVTGLSASPLSFSITPALAPGATQVVAISTTVFTPGGTYTISVSCTGGVGTHTADFQLTVTAAAFDFGVVWSPASASVTAGGSSSPDVVATLVSGTSTSAACSVSLPSPAVAGLSAVPLAFSLMPSAAGASQAVAIATTSATPAGTYTISVSCAGGGVTRAPSTQFSLTVTAPVAVPTVTANSPTPNPANTGEMIMVTFTVTSTTTVTGITVDWGDGTTLDSLAGTATSDHHIYTSTGNLKSQTFTITVTATNTAGPGSGTTMATINDRPPTATISNVSPNPANIGQLVTITFATADPDGTVSSIAVDWGDGSAIDNLSGTATSDTHMYGSANSFTIMVTATDNSGSTGSATAGETVTSVTVTHVLLTFQAQAPQSPSRGPGNLQVFVNGQHVTDITLGLTFTGFGPIDITTFVISGGQNTVTFINPQTNQFNLVKNVTITQGDTILLRVIKTLKVSAGGTLNLTFSLPALATTSITVSSTSPLVGQTVTFTAKFTGGTAPFICVFQFGDDESAVSQGTSGTCKATHDYDSSGTFTATIVIKGASKSGRVVAHLSVNVQEDDD